MSEQAAAAGGAYDRGHVDGAIAARLAEHDQHFGRINGSIDRMTSALQELTMAVQQVRDQQASAAAAAAAALRAASERSWSPWLRIFAVIAACAALATIYVVLRAG